MRTTRSPNPHSSAQHGVPPPPKSLAWSGRAEIVGESACKSTGAAGTEVGHEKRKGGARDVRQASAQVVEALRLRRNRRHCYGSLDAICKRNRWNQRPQKRGAECGRVKEGLEKRHRERTVECTTSEAN